MESIPAAVCCCTNEIVFAARLDRIMIAQCGFQVLMLYFMMLNDLALSYSENGKMSTRGHFYLSADTDAHMNTAA